MDHARPGEINEHIIVCMPVEKMKYAYFLPIEMKQEAITKYQLRK